MVHNSRSDHGRLLSCRCWSCAVQLQVGFCSLASKPSFPRISAVRHSCETALRQCRPTAVTPCHVASRSRWDSGGCLCPGKQDLQEAPAEAGQEAGCQCGCRSPPPSCRRGGHQGECWPVRLPTSWPPSVQVVAGQLCCPHLDLRSSGVVRSLGLPTLCLLFSGE